MSALAPVFGAVCARCNHDFPTYAWPPHNDLCPECLLSMVLEYDCEMPLSTSDNWGMAS